MVAICFLLTTLLTVACGGGGAAASSNTTSDNTPSGTWSIVAVYVDAVEVGVALASCVQADFSISTSTVGGYGDNADERIYRVLARIEDTTPIELARLLPGHGVIAAQALVDEGNSQRVDRAAGRLLAGAPAHDVIAAAISDDPHLETQYGAATMSPTAAISDDPFLETRQYGAATMSPDAANFTGSETFDWSGAVSDQSVSVQGNILAGPAVVRAALEGFQEVMERPGAVLSDGLVAALEAGAKEGGDRRCPRQQGALSAFVAVAGAGDVGDVPSLWIAVPAQSFGGSSPVALLQQAYQAYNEGSFPPVDAALTGSGGLHPAWLGLIALPAAIRGQHANVVFLCISLLLAAIH